LLRRYHYHLTPLDIAVSSGGALALLCLWSVIAFGYSQMPADTAPIVIAMGPTPTPRPPLLPDERAIAEQLHAAYCAACHGLMGEGGTGPRLDTPRVRSIMSEPALASVMRVGVATMAGLGDQLTEAEIDLLVRLLREGL
jgi:mono/diheme cytochrome c family protein